MEQTIVHNYHGGIHTHVTNNYFYQPENKGDSWWKKFLKWAGKKILALAFSTITMLTPNHSLKDTPVEIYRAAMQNPFVKSNGQAVDSTLPYYYLK